MKDNVIRPTTKTREDNNGGVVEIQDSRDGRQGKQQMITMAKMRDNRYGYGGGGDVGRQQMRCGTKERAKWFGRTAVD